MLFAVIAALIGLAAVYLIVRPLFTENGAEPIAPAEAPQLAVFRDQLTELEREAARGLIGKEEAEAARAEIGRRILAVAKSSESAPKAETSRPLGAKVGLAIAATVLLGALGIYLPNGNPFLPDRPLSERAGETAPDRNPALEDRVRELSKALEEDIENAPAWAELGDTLMQLGRPPQAAFAFDQAVRLTERQNGAFLSALAEARVWAIGGLISPDALADFEAALALEPFDGRARYYLGLAELHAGNEAGAAQRWREARNALGETHPWQGQIAAGLRAIETGDTALLMPGPSAEAMRAAAEMTPEERQAMIAEMVGGLRARLEDAPEDMEGWLRLGQSYQVLDRPDDARYAYERALGLNPAEPEALWQLGDLAREAGDVETARTHWQALLDTVDAGSPAAGQVQRALDSLNAPADAP